MMGSTIDTLNLPHSLKSRSQGRYLHHHAMDPTMASLLTREASTESIIMDSSSTLSPRPVKEVRCSHQPLASQEPYQSMSVFKALVDNERDQMREVSAISIQEFVCPGKLPGCFFCGKEQDCSDKVDGTTGLTMSFPPLQEVHFAISKLSVNDFGSLVGID